MWAGPALWRLTVLGRMSSVPKRCEWTLESDLLGYPKRFLSLIGVAVMAKLPPDLGIVTYLGTQLNLSTWSPRSLPGS